MISRFMNLSLQSKLMIFFIVIAMVPLIFLGVFTYQKSSEIVKEQVSEQVLEGLIQTNKSLSFFHKDIEQLSNYIYRNNIVQEVLKKSKTRSDLEKYEDNTEIKNLFDIVEGSKNWKLNIYIIGLNNDRYFTGDFLPNEYDQYFNNWGIFRKANEANGALIWDTHYTIRNVEPQEVVLSAGRLIKNTQTGQPLGFLIIDIPENTIAEIYQNSSNYSNQTFLLDEDGYVISSYPSKATVGLKLKHHALDDFLNNQRGYLKTIWKSKPYIAIYDTGEDTHYKLANFIPEGEIIQKSSLIGYITIILAVIGLIFVFWSAYLFAKTFTVPISRLIVLMKKVEKGDLTVKFHSLFRDEIGILGERFNQMIKRIQSLINESVEKQRLLQEAEIKTLRAQINPHFLYNTLETMSVIAKQKNVKIISDLAVALGDMMRYSIKKNQDLVVLKEDLTLLEHYLFIQHIRFQDKFNIRCNIKESSKELLIPPLLIQPIIENAITHGLEMKMGSGTLEINIYDLGENLYIDIKDDGIGMENNLLKLIQEHKAVSHIPTHTGIGLINVMKRIELYFGSEYGVKIESEVNRGTSVHIKLPVIREGSGKIDKDPIGR
ncbi:cache domain-containing sensor histidine kinase [Heyndrickxia oleronia]|uniref:cache domain-containing sensor histidine kinase n=1 Tax=Heyndrickxia oleronia TaxID=38875 RepID=UPI001B2BECFA|nr:sensor histidine kinase [Heyndrickxia oleronia]GIN39882.1 sensor histidine kinase YesM [Heyndrickxia oleronia]